MTDHHHFDLAAALADEALAHLIGRGDTATLAQAFGVDIEIFADHDYATLHAHDADGELLGAATAITRPGGVRHTGIDMFRAGGLDWWAIQHRGPDAKFWATGTEHYTLTAPAGTGTWRVSTFSADTAFENLGAALEFIARTERDAPAWAGGTA